MKKEDLVARIQEIGTCEDETQRRTMLAQLSEDAGKDYDEFATTKAANETLTNDNESLREANMKLFKMVGVKSEPDDPKEPPKEKRKFEDLFNDKGGIK